MECFVFKRIKINVFLWERKKETDRSRAGSDMTRPSEMFSIAYGVLRVVCSLVPPSEKPQCMRNMEKFLKRKRRLLYITAGRITNQRGGNANVFGWNKRTFQHLRQKVKDSVAKQTMLLHKLTNRTVKWVKIWYGHTHKNSVLKKQIMYNHFLGF